MSRLCVLDDMLFVREYGRSGPTAVVLHGGPGTPGGMAPVARRLAERYRVLEPFQRGSGDGPLSVARHVEDLHEVMLACAGNARSVIVGSSWGAMLALAYAAAHPEWAGPLVLAGCGTFCAEARRRMQETVTERTTEELRRRLEEAEALAHEDERLRAYAEATAPVFNYDAPPQAGVERVDAKAQRETWEDMVRLQAEGTYPQAFVRIRGPVLMVHGAYDPHPGRMIRCGLKSYLPQLEYCELERCGHYPWQERWAAEEFYTVVLGWLQGA